VYLYLCTTEKNGIGKERLKQQNIECCRHGLIEPVHGRQWYLQATVHALYHRLNQKLALETEQSN
jgi:hypothetical protein